jgi:protein arginine kinase
VIEVIDERQYDEHDSDSVGDSPGGLSGSPAAMPPNSSQLASGIVVGCRVRLVRNIAEFPFLEVCSSEQRAEIETAVRASLRHHDWLNELTVLDSQLLEMMEHQFLAELHAVVGLTDLEERSLQSSDSKPQKQSAAQSSDAESDETIREPIPELKGEISLLLNDEDHLRLQVTQQGSDLWNAWRVANQLDDLIEEKLNFAFSPQLGYLTACPANVGTGLRVSVVLHLPALVMSGEFNDWQRKLARSNVMGRELFGDPAGGDFYRFSNQATLGWGEAKLVQRFADVIPQVVAAERKARDRWLQRDRDGLRVEIEGALNALLATDLEDTTDANRFEMTRLLSQIRLGLETGLLSQAQTARIAGMFELIQLQQKLSVAVAAEDFQRASRVRDRINFLEGDSE